MSGKEDEEYKLGSICEIVVGTSFKEIDYSEAGIPVIKVKDIQDGRVIFLSNKYCDLKKFSKSNQINPGDLIVAKDGSFAGKVAINFLKQNFLYDSHVVKIVSNPKLCNKKYLYHLLLSKEKKLRGLSKAGVIPGIKIGDLKEFLISLPTLEKQQKIASKLDILNELKNELKLRERQYLYYRDYLINNPGGGLLRSIFWVMFVKLFLELFWKKMTIQKLELLF